MDSLAGQTISHFRVLSRSGDRPSVYRAEDTLTGRQVRLEFASEDLVADPQALARLRHAARALAALSHPHLAAVFGLGESDGRVFLVTEPSDGETLAQWIGQKQLRLVEWLDLCEQVADALDAAYAAGVVHGALEPSNIRLTRRGQVRVANFGLGPSTAPAYEPPERAQGEIDTRGDLFSLGVILYEMGTGRLPFSGPDAAAIRRAVLEEDPPPPSELNPALPARFDEIVAKAIAKDPEKRYADAAELRGDLRRLRRDWESDRVAAARAALAETAAGQATGKSGRAATGEPGSSKRIWTFVVVTVLLLAAVAFAFGPRLLRRSSPPPVVLTPLLSGRGRISSARFAPGGRTIFYTAQWGNEPPAVFSIAPGSTRGVPLGFSDAEILSVSPSNELAILTGLRVSADGRRVGNLNNVAFAGASAEPLLANVETADWSPAGRRIAVVRRVVRRDRLEYPVGHVLVRTNGWIGDPRFSPDGERIAFIDHPRPNNYAGSVNVVGLSGSPKRLTQVWTEADGLAWSPRGQRIWFTASRGGPQRLYALNLAGKLRRVLARSDSLRLFDIASDGRALLARDDSVDEIGEFARGAKSEVPLPAPSGYALRGVSADGKTLLLERRTGAEDAIFVRQASSAAVRRLGSGRALALSPRGKWVLAMTASAHPHPVVLPVGSGRPINLPAVDVSHLWAAWLPGAKRFVFLGSEPGHRSRLFVEAVAGGPPRSISPPGVGLSAALSPDGRRVAAIGPDGKGYLYPVFGGSVPAFRGVVPGDRLVGWGRNGDNLYVAEGALPARIFRLNLRTGAKRPLWQIAPGDRAGVRRVNAIHVTPDGRFCFFSFRRTLSRLYLARGLN